MLNCQDIIDIINVIHDQGTFFMRLNISKEYPFSYLKNFSFSTRYISPDVPSMQIATTSEKASTPHNFKRRNIALDSYRIVFSKDTHIYVYVRRRVSACALFIYKRFADVIRVYPLIPFIFYSLAASLHCESRCPSASSVALHSLLSVYLSTLL